MALRCTTITTLLEARENNAREHKYDYSHVFRKKSTIDFARLSALSVGIGFIYSAQLAFASPTLLQIGVDYLTMTRIWIITPILGLFFGPCIGMISDRCRLSMGRRRPIMILLSIGILVGFVFLFYGKHIGKLFGDDHFDAITVEESNTPLEGIERKRSATFSVIITILGAILLALNMEICQIPTRAYILDVCISEDQGKVISIFSLTIGLGSTVGYAIGSINWGSTAIGKILGGSIETGCMIVGIIAIVCFLVTFASFREIPLPLLEKDKLLNPLTAAEITRESLKNNVFVINASDANLPETNENTKTETKKNALRKHIKSIVLMPRSMWILTLTHLLTWMGHACYSLYFTDFVGEVIFHGDPAAPIGSEKQILYQDGVRFGVWGMFVFAVSSSIYSFVIEKLVTRFSPRIIYVTGIMTYATGMFILAAWPNEVGVLLLSNTAGIFSSTVYIMPFILVANYHAKSCFEIRKGLEVPLKEYRGLATDIAVISSMAFVGQILSSLFVGLLVSWMKTKSAIFFAASGVSVCAAISAMFVLYIKI
ncbi:solute carrier family 45 member 4-like [Episyrphus balteatus]|uniref:solute carrier family 45 member 4-like n=1 Tax=Episyrphus balteatus TaxID=286459 RepID=UPI002485334D|nr:solute carrier family 45 member 4-like [Episyrphus balteatus]